ncbi:FRG domain-containing protein [Rhizobium sp. S9]|uniref:FRG domain-containing protein n=1 Tax=unclassified Rhizobium TaxID=2613769 RepID=UPI000A21049F|nr:MULTISPECIES: FRG domain-containing protein [unclassified Rhizobium]ARO22870.1 hypothetical protein TAL182_CH01056 [Rhizobium sp. TAL182]PDS95858.1 FRG domain-containing protein [Rhizobium sp. S9]
METIAEESLYSYADNRQMRKMRCLSIRRSKGCFVDSYIDLATKIASLQFKNPNYVMLFRGQKADYRRPNRDHDISTLKPTIFRGVPSPSEKTLTRRFEKLRRAETLLITAYEQSGFPDLERLQRHRILRWSILQHYEVCDTPLLDVTHSLRIAASFASANADGEAFVFALGVPNVSGAITASAEAGLQVIRLSSVCPPAAVRPHIQEGYLLGEYPEMAEMGQKELYPHYEIDFARRVAAKFRFDPRSFWENSDFPQVGQLALYPNTNDPLFELTEAIKLRLKR